MNVETYGVRCELLPYSPDRCVMTSPKNVPSGSMSKPCLAVQYYVSSDNVALTADIFVGDDKIISGVILKHHREINYISLSDLPSMDFTVSFTARRGLTSDEDTHYADIQQVRLESCESLSEC